MTTRKIRISLLENESTHVAVTRDLGVDALCEALTDYQPRETKSGPAWSPITWDECEDNPKCESETENHTWRKETKALGVSCLVYDLDDPSDAEMAMLGRMLAREGWRYVVHETYTAGRWRVVLPLAEDLSPEPSAYRATWEGVARHLGIRPDPTGVDLARLSYLPAHPPGQTRSAEHGGGALLSIEHAKTNRPELLGPANPAKTLDPSKINGLANIPKSQGISNPTDPGRGQFPPGNSSPKIFDLDALRSAVTRLPPETRKPLLEALSFKLVLREGERENQLHKLASALATVLPVGMGWVEVENIFTPVIDVMENNMDHGPGYYMGRVRSSYDRAMEHRAEAEGRTEAARDYFRKEAGAEDAWKATLLVTPTKDGPKVRACTANLDLILEKDPLFDGHIRFNGLARRIEVTGGGLSEHSRETLDSNLSIWLQRSEYEMQLERGTVGNGILTVAKRHEYNPVSTYLEGLKWDGVPRIAGALRNLCGVVGNEKYVESISRKFFISAAARALQPGCKVDTVLVLQGKQGTGKTSFVEELAFGWYTTVSSRVDDKDTRMQATGAWLVELSELASAAKSTIESLRGFLTQRSDDIRIPYATNIENYPRRCVFIGTTNSDQPLVDTEGNRRYWVVATGKFDTRALRQQRDQLWAEAVDCFRQYEMEEAADVPEAQMQYRWWLTPDEQEISDGENAVFQSENPLEWDIMHWAENHAGRIVTATEVAKQALHFTSERLLTDHSVVVRIGRTLRDLKWKRIRKGTSEKRYWAYEVPLTANT